MSGNGRQIYIHEAGHAVAAHHGGYRIDGIMSLSSIDKHYVIFDRLDEIDHEKQILVSLERVRLPEPSFLARENGVCRIPPRCVAEERICRRQSIHHVKYSATRSAGE